MQVRSAQERGTTEIDWLKSYHTFSFGDYNDPQYMGFSDLRVINDDIVQPSGGFATHGHRDMEIITYVISGTLAHKDSLGNGSLIVPGEVQRMTAGTGIQHSEFNPSETEPVHLLQIWIFPQQKGLTPGYDQKAFQRDERLGQWKLLASPDGRDGSLLINQDAFMNGTIIPVGAQIGYELQAGRVAWLHVATGVVQLNGHLLEAGDSAAIKPPDTNLLLEGVSRESEVLLFDLRKLS